MKEVWLIAIKQNESFSGGCFGMGTALKPTPQRPMDALFSKNKETNEIHHQITKKIRKFSSFLPAELFMIKSKYQGLCLTSHKSKPPIFLLTLMPPPGPPDCTVFILRVQLEYKNLYPDCTMSMSVFGRSSRLFWVLS